MTGTDEVSLLEFVDFFDDLKLPLTFYDSILNKKPNDSLLIGHPVLKKYISDTVFAGVYGKEIPKVYAIGKFKNQAFETYLLLATKGSKSGLYVVALDKDNQPKASLPLLRSGKNSNTVNRITVDAKYTFTLTDEYKNSDGSHSEYNTVYAYNTAGLFMTILKDGLPEGVEMPIINPIDTMPAKGKLAGNYGANSRNFISIRDGRSPNKIMFFINFDNGKACTAELKGDALLIGKDSAVYSSNTDPCIIGFKFSPNSIRITEIKNCGNKRPMECSFNASYRKQIVKSQKAKKASKT